MADIEKKTPQAATSQAATSQAATSQAAQETDTRPAAVVAVTGPLGVAIKSILGDSTRITIPATAEALENLTARISAITDAAEMRNLPVCIAGNGLTAWPADAKQAMVGIVSQNSEKDSGGKSQRVIVSLAVAPYYDLAQLTESEEGKAWVEDRIANVMSADAFRPVRSLEPGETISDIEAQMPISLADYITATERGIPGMDMLEKLWPTVRMLILQDTDNEREAKELDRQLPAAAPKKGYKNALPQVAKALRSQSWAEKNTPNLEELRIWEYVGAVMTTDTVVQMAQEALNAQAEEAGVPSVQLDVGAIQQWLARREETTIDPVAHQVEPDLDALASFAARLGRRA